MRRFLAKSTFNLPLKKQTPTVQFFIIVICTSLAISLIWIQFFALPTQPVVNDGTIQKALENVAKDFRYSKVYRKTNRLSKELKYTLLWTPNDCYPFDIFDNGQRAFIKNNCSVISCYVTSDRKFFNGDLTKFDAIAFNGRNMRRNDLPKHRSPRQKYIFFNTESADNYPVCDSDFDGLFNWTSTYRLDSDIPFQYILIRNNRGEVVGLKTDIKWNEELPEVSDDLAERLMNKTKAAAWLVSNCLSKSGRKGLVKKLQKALAPYGYYVDVYGDCGPLKCPLANKNCDTLLEKDYFFYMALENSFAEDYVTEKLLRALQHNMVPIVYGGANYSRFLPPGSYLDANKISAYNLAAIMDRLMNAPKLYKEYFRWKRQYTYSYPMVENVCKVCAALNDMDRVEKVTVYDEFRKWWHPEFKQRC